MQALGIGSHEEDPGKRRVAPCRPLVEPFDGQVRLDADGMGAISAANVPYVLRAKYGQSAMYFGPRQPAEEPVESGQSRRGSAPGADSGTFDWHLLPSPAGSRTSESRREDP